MKMIKQQSLFNPGGKKDALKGRKRLKIFTFINYHMGEIRHVLCGLEERKDIH